MAEYIEREILIKKLLEHFDADFNINGDIMWSDHICTGEDVEDLIDFIKEEIPTADVAEVKHAKWEISSDGYYPYCSHCKSEPENGVRSKYCPECGARMDGAAE